MRIDAANHLTAENDQQQTTEPSAVGEFHTPHVIQIEPEDALESVLMALRGLSAPVVLLLPEQGQALSDPSHFAQLRQVCSPDQVRLMIPPGRIEALGQYAHQYGFFFASSLEQAIQFLPAHKETRGGISQEGQELSSRSTANVSTGTNDHLVEDLMRELGEQEASAQQTVSPQRSPQPVVPLPERAPQALEHKPSAMRRIGLMATMVTLLVAAGAVLLPSLFSVQPELDTSAAPAMTTVGQVAFQSSGQFDLLGTTGSNDIVIISLSHLSTPAAGQSYYGWLMPDKGNDSMPPLLLGRLTISDGQAQITYAQPDHENLLALYSRFEVAEQPSSDNPAMPPLDPKAVQYEGSIPNIPTPGDEQHYSLLDHMRHLLAKDPTLQTIGLQGGLDLWLDRNSEKVFEWASAARDSWPSGQQTQLIHRQMIRILQYLDGSASQTNDLPPGTPLLVDPQQGRIGLLPVSPTQEEFLPAYTVHVDTHLEALANSPGHTQAQQQLALKIDHALQVDISYLQRVHQDAVQLVKMADAQLKTMQAQSLLNDLATNATNAYVGQLNSATGGDVNGIAWIHNELQGLATISVIPTAKNE